VQGVGRRMLGVALGHMAKGLCVVHRARAVWRRASGDGRRALVVSRFPS
jgi:hypothetical protein